MGIPSYFSYVVKNHSKIIKRLQDVKCNQLFIDANSLIYEVVHETQEDIYEKVYQKILNLINKLNPEFTFVAFDGVAPLAKMKQQKQRRYKSYVTKQLIQSNKWNTNAITPGTTFMNELDSFLSNKFNKNIVFSGSNQVGEGEHKIMDYMRQHPCTENQFIYGLDADLIMLGLLHVKHNENVYLYRETCHFSYLKNIRADEDYVFSLKDMATQINEYGLTIDNYCFLCFLFGNDFMPHFPSLNIRNDAIPYLLEVYKKVDMQLIVDGKIQWDSFRQLCIELGYTEEERIKINIEWKKKLKVYPLTTEEELNFLPVKDRSREDYLYQNMNQYYTLLFHQDEVNPCKNYLEMLDWTWAYYNGVCKDYYKMYEFSHAPLFKSLVKYVPCFDEVVLATSLDAPPLALTQLIYVLPYQDYHLVPINTAPVVHEFPNLSELYFPIHYDFCKFFWESHVTFNYINIKDINHYINGHAIRIE